MEDNLQKICLWKEIANEDDKKRRNGDNLITLGKDKICYKCDGTFEGAQKLGCDLYVVE